MRHDSPDHEEITQGKSNVDSNVDFWLISKRLLSRVTKTDICAYYDSDHSPVTISIKPEGKHERRGPGFWKFNNPLLQNEEFI